VYGMNVFFGIRHREITGFPMPLICLILYTIKSENASVFIKKFI
jgi:hypothetical protein